MGVRLLFYHVREADVKQIVSTAGATSLNRILRITAKLLFEKGEDVASVSNLMQGFVTPGMIRAWYNRHCEVEGVAISEMSKRNLRRMPMPPIDFQAIEITDLNQLLEKDHPSREDELVEPNW